MGELEWVEVEWRLCLAGGEIQCNVLDGGPFCTGGRLLYFMYHHDKFGMQLMLGHLIIHDGFYFMSPWLARACLESAADECRGHQAKPWPDLPHQPIVVEYRAECRKTR